MKGLFDESIGILETHKPFDRFNVMAWGAWASHQDTYAVNPFNVNVLYFYSQIGKIRVLRKEDMQTILDHYHATKKILDEVTPEDPQE